MSPGRLVERLFAPDSSRSTGDRILRIAAAISYMGLIFYVSSIPGTEITSPVDDRAAHFIEYLILGILFMFTAAAFVDRWTTGPMVAVTLAGLLHGALDEWHQSFVPNRDVSARDVLFDALGTAAGVIIVRSISGWKLRR